MISILIPVYNNSCDRLVSDLHKQAEALGIEFEIIVMDDCSTDDESKLKNRTLRNLCHCRYIENAQNVGRSRIRNLLAAEARFGLLLFMDSDAIVVRPAFIAKYLEAAKQHDVVCGGICHSTTPPPANMILRYIYEIESEKKVVKNADDSDPCSPFKTFNFLIKKEIFDQIKFDERYSEYGFEDAKFGIDLKTRGYSVYQIDNPLQHDGLGTNEEFVNKVETSLHTLYKFSDDLRLYTRLLQMTDKLNALHMLPIARIAYRIFGSMMRKNLCSSHPCIRLLNIYKLCYYSAIRK